MNILALPKMIFSYTEGWDDLVRMRPTVAKMFALFVLPMSLIPPLMIFYAGSKYGAEALPHMSSQDLQLIMAIFFLAEIVAVPIVALLIQRLGEVVEIRPSYQDAFLLAAVAPTPLWLAALVLFIPSVAVNLIAGALAMLAAAGLIYHGVNPVFKLEDQGKAILLAGSIFAAGLVAWVTLMVLTLLVWGYR